MKNQQANIARVNHLLFMLFNILTGNKEEFQQFRVMLNCLVLTRSQGFLKNFALLQLIPVFEGFKLSQNSFYHVDNFFPIWPLIFAICAHNLHRIILK